MSATTEHKSIEGKATITATHLVYEYNLLGRMTRPSKRSDIPLDQISAIRVVPGSPSFLQVETGSPAPEQFISTSPLAFALDGRQPHEPFVAALTQVTGIASDRVAAPPHPPTPSPQLPSSEFGGYKLRDGVLKGRGTSVSMQGAEAEATQGAPSQRSTLTRMGAGALIAGPIGFVVGAVARKNTSKCYVTVGVPDGVVVIESKAKEFADAVKFADAVNRTARALSDDA